MAKKKIYKDWEITGYGGFSTVRHFWAEKDEKSFWRFLLRDCKVTIDDIEDGKIKFEEIEPLYRKALYQ